MKIRIMLSMTVLLSFTLFGCNNYKEGTAERSIEQPMTKEKAIEMQLRAYNHLPKKYQNEIDDIYSSDLLAFKADSEFLIKNNGKKVNIKQVETTIVAFSPKEEANDNTYEVFLDENGEKFLGYKVSKGN